MKEQGTSPQQIVFLKGLRTTLRPVSTADVPMMTRWVNDPEIRRYVKRWLPMTELGETEWVQGLSKRSDTDVTLVIEVKGKPIGVIGIRKINWKDRTAVTGAMIGEKAYWGKGYGTDAKMALLEYAFNTMGLRKMSSHVYAFNSRSIGYSKRCGYVEEGRLRSQRFIGGEYHDEIILGLFKEEWLPHWKAHLAGRKLKLAK